MKRSTRETAVHHFAEERLVDCDCEARLALPLLHHGRWSEVQFARCCGCGAVQAYIPVGDDPRELNRAGANRAVPIDHDVTEWLAQWPMLIEERSELSGPFWLPARACFTDTATQNAHSASLVHEQRTTLPAQRLRAAGFPLAPTPTVYDARLRVALHAMERVREALHGALPRDVCALEQMISDIDPRRHVALESLLRARDREQLFDAIESDSQQAPWGLMLRLLHWGPAREALWQRYLDGLSNIPLTPISGVEGLVRESFMLRTLLDDLAISNAPRDALGRCLTRLLARSTGRDERLTTQITDLTKDLFG